MRDLPSRITPCGSAATLSESSSTTSSKLHVHILTQGLVESSDPCIRRLAPSTEDEHLSWNPLTDRSMDGGLLDFRM